MLKDGTLMAKKMGGIELYKRRQLIEPKSADISQKMQYQLLGITRSLLCYELRKPSEEDLLLKRAIEEGFVEHPNYEGGGCQAP
jgi:hypothetical protein